MGKNPKNKNSSVSNPEIESAAIGDDGPGIGIISVSGSSSSIFFIKNCPGSEIPGVPASEIRAIFFVSLRVSIIKSTFASLEC